MSLPPRVRWEYGFNPDAGSAEARLADYLDDVMPASASLRPRAAGWRCGLALPAAARAGLGQPAGRRAIDGLRHLQGQQRQHHADT
ncbi:hypothetical protein G6F22_021503 [Rhizopus arrhizus]|nr:hypothetical protein G6F23_014049 [Rhizopus arrhizus]KAG0753327.1 hypothetical protein G6F22_021503 [Rhizopus arrhizus]